MRAAFYDGYGGPEVLREGAAEVPMPKAHTVLVRVHAASVDGGELAVRAGKFRLFTGNKFPKRTGVDFVGEIVDVGAAVTGFEKGERVWGIMRRFGSMAEYVSVDPKRISRAPKNLSSIEAVSLPTGGTTGITALRDKARLKPGERLLVRGASGGVGSVVTQLGKMFGAHVVALAGSANHEFVRGLGADEVYDYRTTGPSDLGTFDVIVDTAGTEHPRYRTLLRPGGRMVAISFDTSNMPAGPLYILGSAIYGSRRVRFFSGNPEAELFAELGRYAQSGQVRPVVDTVHPLADIAVAHRALEAGGVRGKHVIHIG